MKKFFLASLLLCSVLVAKAQNTSLSGTVTDPDGINWALGNINVQLVNNSGTAATINRIPLTAQQLNFNMPLSGTGTFTGTAVDNTRIDQVGTSYNLIICPQASSPCQSLNGITLAGASMNLTSAISTTLQALRFPAGYGSRAYTSVEISPIPPVGTTYYDITQQKLFYWNGTTWVAVGNGIGTITANNLAGSNASGTLVGVPEKGTVTISGITAMQWDEDTRLGKFDPYRPRIEKIDGNNTLVSLLTNSALALQQTMNDASCWAQNNLKESTVILPPGAYRSGVAQQVTLTVGPGVHVLGTPGGTAGLGGGINGPVGGTTLDGNYNNAPILIQTNYTAACSDGTVVADTMDGGDIENLQVFGCAQGGCVNAPGDTNNYLGGAGPYNKGIYQAVFHGTTHNLRGAYTGGPAIDGAGVDGQFWDSHSYSALTWYRFGRQQLPIVAPGTVTPTPSTTGGTFAAGTYFFKVTARTDSPTGPGGPGLIGETTPSVEVSATTTGTTGSISLTWVAIPGASTYRVYRGTTAGGETGYQVASSNTFVDTGAGLTTATVPVSNTSGTYNPATDGIHAGVQDECTDCRYHSVETYGNFQAPGSELAHVCGFALGGGANSADDVFEQIDEMGICIPLGNGNKRLTNFRAEGNALASMLVVDGAFLANNGIISQGCTNQASVIANNYCDDLIDVSAGGGSYSNVNIYNNPSLGTSFRTGFMAPSTSKCSNVNACDGTGFERSFIGAGGDQIGKNSWVSDQWKAIISGDVDSTPFEVLGTVLSGTSPNIAGSNYFYFTNGSATSVTGVTNPITGQPLHISIDHNTTLVSLANGGPFDTCTGANIVGPAGVLDFEVMDYGTHHRIKEHCNPLAASQVLNAADKSSASVQAFTGAITASTFTATSLPTGCASLPCVVAKANFTGTTNTGPTTLYTIPAGQGGLYQASCYLVVTVAATTSSQTPNCQIINYVDADTGLTISHASINGNSTANTVGTFNSGIGIINLASGSVVPWGTANYTSVGATAMTYAVHLKLQYIGPP